MFWKKKEEVTPNAVIPAAAKVERLPEPEKIPDMVRRYLIDNLKMDIVWVCDLKAVVRRCAEGKPGFDIRVYDALEMADKKVKVKDYTSLDGRPDLMVCEGWFDRQTNQIELKDLTIQDYPILNEVGIQQKIEGLKEPASTVFFYLARGSASGGPLRRGAAIVELNPDYPGAKQKKYNIYQTYVMGTEPVDKGQKVAEADKSQDAAKWIKSRHFKPWWYRTLAKK